MEFPGAVGRRSDRLPQVRTATGRPGAAAASKAEFQVKFLFVTAYDYRHQATERWDANCLRTLGSVTDDNGDAFEVAGT